MKQFLYLYLLSLLLLAVDIRVGMAFFAVSFILNILVYTNKMSKENYQLDYVNFGTMCDNVPSKVIHKNTDYAVCNDVVVVDDNYQSINQKLAGYKGNPKTRVAPVITTPIYALAQRDNDLIVPNIINDQTNDNLALAGYTSDYSICASAPPEPSLPSYNKPQGNLLQDLAENYVKNGISKNRNNMLPEYNENMFNAPFDYVNTQSGYNPPQLFTANFPANGPQGNCAQSPRFNDYNDNLFTQNVQPGVYYQEQVIEPINSNIGISFTQQFLPKTYERTANGGTKRIDHDPIIDMPPPEIIEDIDFPKPENIYDPRFSGYGTSYRGYVDNVVGQPRYFYDDINSVRMPNYIVRSNIDIHDYADVYGPMQTGGLALNDIKRDANLAFEQDSLLHRNEIMERVMRKSNARMWQQRQFPLNRNVNTLPMVVNHI